MLPNPLLPNRAPTYTQSLLLLLFLCPLSLFAKARPIVDRKLSTNQGFLTPSISFAPLPKEEEGSLQKSQILGKPFAWFSTASHQPGLVWLFQKEKALFLGGTIFEQAAWQPISPTKVFGDLPQEISFFQTYHTEKETLLIWTQTEGQIPHQEKVLYGAVWKDHKWDSVRSLARLGDTRVSDPQIAESKEGIVTILWEKMQYNQKRDSIESRILYSTIWDGEKWNEPQAVSPTKQGYFLRNFQLEKSQSGDLVAIWLGHQEKEHPSLYSTTLIEGSVLHGKTWARPASLIPNSESEKEQKTFLRYDLIVKPISGSSVLILWMQEHIATFSEQTCELYGAVWNGVSFTKPHRLSLPEAGAVFVKPQMATANDGSVVLLWEQYPETNQAHLEKAGIQYKSIYTTTWTGSSWLPSQKLEGQGIDASGIVLVQGLENTVVAAFSQRDADSPPNSQQKAYTAIWQNQKWQPAHQALSKTEQLGQPENIALIAKPHGEVGLLISQIEVEWISPNQVNRVRYRLYGQVFQGMKASSMQRLSPPQSNYAFSPDFDWDQIVLEEGHSLIAFWRQEANLKKPSFLLQAGWNGKEWIKAQPVPLKWGNDFGMVLQSIPFPKTEKSLFLAETSDPSLENPHEHADSYLSGKLWDGTNWKDLFSLKRSDKQQTGYHSFSPFVPFKQYDMSNGPPHQFSFAFDEKQELLLLVTKDNQLGTLVIPTP